MSYIGKPFKWTGRSFFYVEKVLNDMYPNIEVTINIDSDMACYQLLGGMYIGKVYNVNVNGSKILITMSAYVRLYDMVDLLIKVISTYIADGIFHRPLNKKERVIYNNIKTKYIAISTAETRDITTMF